MQCQHECFEVIQQAKKVTQVRQRQAWPREASPNGLMIGLFFLRGCGSISLAMIKTPCNCSMSSLAETVHYLRNVGGCITC